jgi:hypothetical protein
MRTVVGFLRPLRAGFFPDPLFLILHGFHHVFPCSGQPVFLQAD